MMQDDVAMFLRGSVFFSVAFGIFRMIKYMKEANSLNVEERSEGNKEAFDITKEKVFIDAMYVTILDCIIPLFLSDVDSNRYKEFAKTQNSNSSVSDAPIFQHQVAGHTREVLRKMQDKVLKPMIKPKLFLNEVRY